MMNPVDNGAVDHRLLSSLDAIRDTPLNRISDDQKAGVIQRILGRDANEAVVDVARFTSAI